MALSLRSSAAFQQSLDGAFTAFKRSIFKNNWMALSLRSSAAKTSIIILGWRFHFVQAQPLVLGLPKAL
jgi:hypothetical protein